MDTRNGEGDVAIASPFRKRICLTPEPRSHSALSLEAGQFPVGGTRRRGLRASSRFHKHCCTGARRSV
jgi:hypothetical protein